MLSRGGVKSNSDPDSQDVQSDRTMPMKVTLIDFNKARRFPSEGPGGIWYSAVP